MLLHRHSPQHLPPPFAGSPDVVGRNGFSAAVPWDFSSFEENEISFSSFFEEKKASDNSKNWEMGKP